MTTQEATWTDDDTAKCKRIWEMYQKEHDLSDRIGDTAGIDPQSGKIWLGESALDVVRKRDAEGFYHPLFFERIGYATYLRKGNQR
jgi:hypothetical protein